MKLDNNPTMEEINQFYNLESNFNDLLEKYLRSGDIQHKFSKSKSTDQKKFIRNQRAHIKKLYEEEDNEKPRMKEFKKWISDNYEMRITIYKRKDNDTDKDKLILSLQNLLEEKDKSLKHHKARANFFKKQYLKLKKEKNNAQQAEQQGGLSQPEAIEKEEPQYDPDYDSDDDITEDPIKVDPPKPQPEPQPQPQPEPKPQPIQEQLSGEQLEEIARKKYEEKTNEINKNTQIKSNKFKLLEDYYNNCDKKAKQIYNQFMKEVKGENRLLAINKLPYKEKLSDWLEEYRDDYTDLHTHLEDNYEDMFNKPYNNFCNSLPSEMVQMEIET